MTFEDFVAWLKLTISDTDYTYSRGMWIDSAAMNQRKILAVFQTGGPAPDTGDRRQNYRVIMFGKRDTRTDMVVVANDMERLMQAALGDVEPCGAANARAIGEPNGPSFTTENRAFVMLDFEVLF